jgi:hypothetical protein
LIVDSQISCSNDIYPYYLPGAVPVLLIVVLGLPYLFLKLIQVATKLVGEAPVPDMGELTQNEIW